jgi:hypothetical protein
LSIKNNNLTMRDNPIGGLYKPPLKKPRQTVGSFYAMPVSAVTSDPVQAPVLSIHGDTSVYPVPC